MPALAATLAALPAGAADCTRADAADPFPALRYDDGFCPAGPDDPWWLQAKSLPAPGGQLAVGGELRVRTELADPPDFGRADPGADRFTLYRALVHADLHGERWRGFLQLNVADSSGRRGGAAGTDVNRGDLHQAFADLALAPGWRLRAGRQEWLYGSGRLVSLRDGPNIRRAFDGAVLRAERAGLRVDALAGVPVELRPDSVDDRPDDRQSLAGLYATLGAAGRGLDLYWLRFVDRDAVFADASGREQRESLGLRLFGAAGPLRGNVEAVVQAGRVATTDIAAWTLAVELTTDLTADGRVAAGLRTDLASGDGDRADGDLGTFNALYPNPTYFSQAALVYPANLIDVHPFVRWQPDPRLTLTLEADWLWRHRRADSFYVQPLEPIALPDGASRRIGWQAGLCGELQLTANWSVQAWLVHFAAGSALVGAGLRDVDYAAASVTFRF